MDRSTLVSRRNLATLKIVLGRSSRNGSTGLAVSRSATALIFRYSLPPHVAAPPLSTSGPRIWPGPRASPNTTNLRAAEGKSGGVPEGARNGRTTAWEAAGGGSVENLNPEKHRIGFDEGARAWFAGQSIAASVATGPLIHDMGWTFLISDGAGLFITSDSPCSVIDPTAKTVFVGRYALVNEKSELILPLRRDVALIATWGSEPLVWMKATPEVIRSINLRTARFAERMLMSPTTEFPGSEDLKRVAEEAATAPGKLPRQKRSAAGFSTTSFALGFVASAPLAAPRGYRRR